MPNASAGEITKAISESWRSLSDAERERFHEIASEDKKRYERQKKPTEKKVLEAHETVIPVARVKKIAKLDPEMKSLSKEATAVLAKMCELFVGKIATETHVASSGKKIIKASDVAHCIHARPAFAWLRVDYPLNEYKEKKEPSASAAAAKKPPPANNASIDQFLSAPAAKKSKTTTTNAFADASSSSAAAAAAAAAADLLLDNSNTSSTALPSALVQGDDAGNLGAVSDQLVSRASTPLDGDLLQDD